MDDGIVLNEEILLSADRKLTVNGRYDCLCCTGPIASCVAGAQRIDSFHSPTCLLHYNIE
jgi:hypothetical protein